MSGKILILDPDPNEIGAVSARLREAGYETVIASKGRAALEKVAEVQPEVVVLSAELAEVDALEVKSALGSDPASPTHPGDPDGGRRRRAARTRGHRRHHHPIGVRRRR